MSELWDVFCEDSRENWPRYNDTALYWYGFEISIATACICTTNIPLIPIWYVVWNRNIYMISLLLLITWWSVQKGSCVSRCNRNDALIQSILLCKHRKISCFQLDILKLMKVMLQLNVNVFLLVIFVWNNKEIYNNYSSFCYIYYIWQAYMCMTQIIDMINTISVYIISVYILNQTSALSLCWPI